MRSSTLTKRILHEMKAEGFALTLEAKPLPAGATIVVHRDPKAELHRRFRAESGGVTLLSCISATALLGYIAQSYPDVPVSLAAGTLPEDITS